FPPTIRNIHRQPEPPVPQARMLRDRLRSLLFLDCSSSSNPSLTIGLLAYYIQPHFRSEAHRDQARCFPNQLGLNSPGQRMSPTFNVRSDALDDFFCASTRCTSRPSAATLIISMDASRYS